MSRAQRIQNASAGRRPDLDFRTLTFANAYYRHRNQAEAVLQDLLSEIRPGDKELQDTLSKIVARELEAVAARELGVTAGLVSMRYFLWKALFDQLPKASEEWKDNLADRFVSMLLDTPRELSTLRLQTAAVELGMSFDDVKKLMDITRQADEVPTDQLFAVAYFPVTAPTATGDKLRIPTGAIVPVRSAAVVAMPKLKDAMVTLLYQGKRCWQDVTVSSFDMESGPIPASMFANYLNPSAMVEGLIGGTHQFLHTPAPDRVRGPNNRALKLPYMSAKRALNVLLPYFLVTANFGLVFELSDSFQERIKDKLRALELSQGAVGIAYVRATQNVTRRAKCFASDREALRGAAFMLALRHPTMVGKATHYHGLGAIEDIQSVDYNADPNAGNFTAKAVEAQVDDIDAGIEGTRMGVTGDSASMVNEIVSDIPEEERSEPEVDMSALSLGEKSAVESI